MPLWGWAILVALILVIGREIWFWLILPVKARIIADSGDWKRARKIIEKRLSAFSLLGERSKIADRYWLAMLYMVDKRYDEAIEQCRKLLSLRLKPSMESEVRQLLADCLEATGKSEEAQSERQKAAEILLRAPVDLEKLQAEAQRLEREGKLEEAYETYKRALEIATRYGNDQRVATLIQFAITAYELGKPEETVKYAEEAISLEPEPSMLHYAHITASLGYAAIGDLEREKEHVSKAAAVALMLRNEEMGAQALVRMAIALCRKGEFVKAMEMCEEAAKMSLKVRRRARLVQAECLKWWGRLDEAKELLEQAIRAEGLPVPSLERTQQGLIVFELAKIEAEKGNINAAIKHLEESREEANRIPKIGLTWKATAAWIYALARKTEEALRYLDEVERQVEQFSQDRMAQSDIFALMGKATLALGETARSIAYWERCLEVNPVPVSRPTILYHLGECYFRQGEIERAKALWNEAANCGFDTADARKAHKRLQAILST
ncbi:MAG: tetratricopeptide repeat protein [Armatimonadetes bacterium]|nr:tetratricopeptide repeat protein [Armatimonadota bacterium]MDW8027416.1 tetratricopeptide repeat protein [Armatimonadota bacterium]